MVREPVMVTVLSSDGVVVEPSVEIPRAEVAAVTVLKLVKERSLMVRVSPALQSFVTLRTRTEPLPS